MPEEGATLEKYWLHLYPRAQSGPRGSLLNGRWGLGRSFFAGWMPVEAGSIPEHAVPAFCRVVVRKLLLVFVGSLYLQRKSVL